jgi:tetratricopeptide (TPR) repeat protein
MTPQHQLESALAHHRANRLGEAEKIYRQILAANPKNPDALFLLGSLAHQTGNSSDAENLLNQAIQINPNAPDYHLNLAMVLASQQRLPEAAVSYKKSISLRPHPTACFNLAAILSQMGDSDSAANAYRQAISLNPQFPDAYNNLGGVLANLKRLEEAVTAFHQAIVLKPNFAEAQQNLGQALTDLNRYDEAVVALQKSLALQPNSAAAHNSLGIALQRLGRLEEALAAFHQAMKLEPRHADYVNHLGMALGDMGRLEEAMAIFQQAVALRPAHADYLYNMGIALEDLARPRDALGMYSHALALRPDFPEAHMSNGMVHLLLGDFLTGWNEYEWRKKCPHVPMQRNISQPQWTGGDLQGKTILLHWEQGLGDTIHFIRYAPLLAERGANVILKCQPQLINLLNRVDGIASVAAKEQLLPPFDLQCPLLSLPIAFGTTLETIPAQIPYISAPPDRVATWRERIGPPDGRLRIGLSWAGQPKHRNDRRRSMRLDQFSPLAEIKSARFFSLQKNAAPAHPIAPHPIAPPPGIDFIDCTADLDDFAETASLIANLDLVICVDTSVAHLAGAMGKPVYLLLPFVPDWRWMLNRIDSPWYPTMKLFRQPAMGDWDTVIANLTRALSQENPR